MGEKRKSIYMLGAEDGLLMGPLMAATAILFGVSSYVPWMSVIALICALAVPVLAYYRLAISFRDNPTYTLSALWLQGICMFFFGGLIMALAVFISLRWVAPEFMVRQIDAIIAAYSAMDDPQALVWADTFRKLKDSGGMPTALDMALEMLYFTVFSGSFLSLIYSSIIRRKRKKEVPPPYNPDI